MQSIFASEPPAESFWEDVLATLQLLLLLTVYLVGVNAGAAGLFWFDKKCAEYKQWRIPEATLCATAVAGGWIGGSWAMQRFRHKTAKQSFKNKYNASIAVNLAGGGALVASPAVRQKLLRLLK